MSLCRCALLCLALTLAGSAPAARPSWNSYQDCLREIRRQGLAPAEWIGHSCVFTYSARKPVYDAAGCPVPDPQGRPATTPVSLSGRVFFPPAWRVGDGARLPLVVYSHATELRKDAVPSAFGGQEWPLAAAAAAWFGFAVAMPDLPGAGADAAAFHPYCHAQSLAYAVADSIPAVRQLTGTDPFLTRHGYGWDGRLFLMGYSEGGYATLAAVRELEAGGQAAFTGSACMAGPFDLSGAMRATFIDPVTRYPRPYYLPYFVRGYHAVYGPRLDPLAVFAPTLLEAGADGDVLTWTDGSQDGLVVDAELGRRLGMPPDAVNLRVMFNPPWLAEQLDDPAYAASPVHALLAENDLYAGWRPTRPILFCHSPDDMNIPYANTLTTIDGLGREIRAAGGDPAELLFLLPIGRPGDHIAHTEGALFAIPSAFAWFYFGMPDLGTFAGQRW
jgi:hypothetical protein